jgi:pimeloyl-ACP methyl ester carboxylesterase
MQPFSPPKALEIPGYEQISLPCVLHSYGGERSVAVVFPGAAQRGNRLGGTPARPDLHYTRAVLQAAGLAVFEVWWDAGSLPKDDREGWLDANLSAALTAASQEHSLALLAGRSLGTWALARAVSKSDWKAHPLPTVWLAPLLNHPPVLNALKELRAPAFVVGGSSDEAFDLTEAELLKKSGADVIVLDGADHGLEVDNPAASARHLADVLDEMRGFVNRATSSATLQ